MKQFPKIILASASPRRSELLHQIGISFTVIPAVSEETTDASAPSEIVKALSFQKAKEVSSRPNVTDIDAIVIGADTVVCIDNKVMGKPKNEKDAFQMLNQLQGKTHQVYTGVTLFSTKKESHPLTFADCTEVTLYPMSEDEILSYIATNEPLDKAGAYAIQGKFAAYIKEIHGEYNNVVGLPISHVYHALKDYCS